MAFDQEKQLLISLRFDEYKVESYHGKETIRLFSTLASVVGPNRTGKSNPTDAISFVSGIKSAQMRSSQSDLIAVEGKPVHVPRRLKATRVSVPEETRMQEDCLAGLRRDLKVVQKAAGAARDAARKAATQQNLSLRKMNLEEYHKLKTVANIGVDKWQALRTLTRDEKTSGQA
ncbi:hypothetical protein BD410DRAFT_810648 [Rickenella mellea]|uniref:Uncharacterized protein n=1 Tax=Rickenella mellea TaxID=50990 RepID=A0A4Y7PG44_9AGAM|nr:hypothetical protein BD410DRAFT_810648 [Rickenella mellea]